MSVSEDEIGPKELEQILSILERLGINVPVEMAPIDPLELVREVINNLNSQIMDLANDRVKYKINLDNYDAMDPGHNMDDRARLGRNDKISLSSNYLPCLAALCEEGNDSPDDFEKCLAIDRKLMPLINQRIGIGEAVALHKKLWEIDTNDTGRESVVKESMVTYAQREEYNIEPDRIRGFFQVIMDRNKEVQKCYRRKLKGPGEPKAVVTIRVGPKDMIEGTKIEAIRQAKRKDPSQTYVARVTVDKDKMYKVEAHPV